MGPGLISQPKINGPRNIFCINFPTIFGPIWGRGRARGWGVGGWGVKGGTWKFPKLGPTHRWLSVGGGGCMYVRMLCTYIHMYVFMIQNVLGPRAHGSRSNESPSDFFLEITNSPVSLLIGHSNHTNIYF